MLSNYYKQINFKILFFCLVIIGCNSKSTILINRENLNYIYGVYSSVQDIYISFELSEDRFTLIYSFNDKVVRCEHGWTIEQRGDNYYIVLKKFNPFGDCSDPEVPDMAYLIRMYKDGTVELLTGVDRDVVFKKGKSSDE